METRLGKAGLFPKNGGVAILGSAAVAGEDRAQRAIEEAIRSPLLNDNDIKGWCCISCSLTFAAL